MRILFIHQAFPGQFEHVARHMAREGHQCVYVSQAPDGADGAIRNIHYETSPPGARLSSYLAQDIDQQVWHAAGVYEALKPLSAEIEPDLILGHAGWGSTLFLPELYPGVPVVDYFEYFYHPHQSAIDFRPDFPPSDRAVLRHRVQNALVMLHLEYCTAGYAPTHFQQGLLPLVYRPKVRVIHDGIDTAFWHRAVDPVRSENDTRIVTYVSRGLEAMRGFDIFMKTAKLIYEEYPDVVFLVAGWDTVEYGADLEFIKERTFKEHVLNQDDYDLDRIRFLGPVPPQSLVRILGLSDLHIYLTVPFVLSWSLLDAMACRCTVLASDVAPVREVITDGQNGLLREFFDVDGLAEAAVSVLRDPEGYRDLGRAAERTVQDRYSLDVVLPRMVSFLEDVAAGRCPQADQRDAGRGRS